MELPDFRYEHEVILELWPPTGDTPVARAHLRSDVAAQLWGALVEAAEADAAAGIGDVTWDEIPVL
jgi:hypothetical protein